jgi:hypothetical protein
MNRQLWKQLKKYRVSNVTLAEAAKCSCTVSYCGTSPDTLKQLPDLVFGN